MGSSTVMLVMVSLLLLYVAWQTEFIERLFGLKRAASTSSPFPPRGPSEGPSGGGSAGFD